MLQTNVNGNAYFEQKMKCSMIRTSDTSQQTKIVIAQVYRKGREDFFEIEKLMSKYKKALWNSEKKGTKLIRALIL